MAKGIPPPRISNVPFPCTRECPKRTFDCHAHCKEYADYHALCEAERGKRLLKCQVQEAKAIAIARVKNKR